MRPSSTAWSTSWWHTVPASCAVRGWPWCHQQGPHGGCSPHECCGRPRETQPDLAVVGKQLIHPESCPAPGRPLVMLWEQLRDVEWVPPAYSPCSCPWQQEGAQNRHSQLCPILPALSLVLTTKAQAHHLQRQKISFLSTY